MRVGRARPAPFSRFLVRHSRGEANPRRINFREPDVLFGHYQPLLSLLAAPSEPEDLGTCDALRLPGALRGAYSALRHMANCREHPRCIYRFLYGFRRQPGLRRSRQFSGSTRKSAFHSSLWRTLAYTFLSVILNVSMAIGLAILLAHPRLSRGRTFFKLAIFLPVITPDVASFIVWKWMFNQNFGVVNQALLALGLPPFAGITQPGSAFVTLVLVEAWHHVGLYTLIFLTNLQLLDTSLDESAQLDGAGRWQRFFHVTLPQLRPAITINTVYALIEFLKTFTVIFVITKGAEFFNKLRFLLCLF